MPAWDYNPEQAGRALPVGLYIACIEGAEVDHREADGLKYMRIFLLVPLDGGAVARRVVDIIMPDHTGNARLRGLATALGTQASAEFYEGTFDVDDYVGEWIFLSLEPRRDNPDRNFIKYYAPKSHAVKFQRPERQLDLVMRAGSPASWGSAIEDYSQTKTRQRERAARQRSERPPPAGGWGDAPEPRSRRPRQRGRGAPPPPARGRFVMPGEEGDHPNPRRIEPEDDISW